MFKGLFLLVDYEPLNNMGLFLSLHCNRKVWGQ